MKKKIVSKKLVAGFISAMLIAGTLAGCGQKNDSAYYNEEFKTMGMKTVSGQGFDIESNANCFYIRSLGTGTVFTDLLNKKKTETRELQMSLVKENGLVFGYDIGIKGAISSSESEGKEDLNEVMSFCTKLEDVPYEHQFLLAGIWRDDETAAQSDFEEFKSNFKNIENILSTDGYKFYFAWNDEFDTSKLTEEEKTDFEAVVKDIKEVKNNLCFFKPEITQDDSAKFAGDFTEFTAKDMEGNEVTQDIFKDYDLTMVNIWSTDHTASVEELAELEQLRTMLPRNANLITICANGSGKSDSVKTILSKKNCKLQTLVDGNSLNGAVLDHVSQYPTTLFVDKDGNVVGQPQIGTPATKSELGDMADMMGDDVVIGAVPNMNGSNDNDSSEASADVDKIQEGADDGFIIMGEGTDADLSGMEDGVQISGDCNEISETEEDKTVAEKYLDIINMYLEYMQIVK